MQFPPIAVVTDSAASIPYDLQAKLAVTVVPVHVTIRGELFTEGVNISSPRVIGALLAGSTVTTSEPTPDEFLATYASLAEQGVRHIVSVHVASALSKTYASAVEAATKSPIPVTVVDTRTLAMAAGFAALGAAAIAKYDGSADAVTSAARRIAATSRLTFTVDTLEYLRRGGRVSATVAAFGTMLNIRPVMEIRNGETNILDRVRKTARAREEVRELMGAYADSLTRPVAAIALVGASAIEAGLGVTGSAQIEASPGASLTAHTGPGMYAVAIADMPAEYFLAV